jgi:succinoglycan biosynthesis protein ExoO
VAERHAAEDPRVRVLDGPRAGLAAIRNTSLEAARGRWAAILDSDDMLHPRHVEWLVAAAERTKAEIVAANMVSFRVEAGRTRTELFADAPGWREERWLTLVDYVRANSATGDAVSAGYLKPLFDMEFLRRHRLRYDLRLRIAEDYDLVARALAAGASYRFLPCPTYFYRRHDASTSHRQSVADLSGMLAAADAAAAGSHDPDLLAAVAARTAGIRSALRHAKALDALKARRSLRALLQMGADRGAWRLMLQTFVEGGTWRLRRSGHEPPLAAPVAVVIGTPTAGSDVAVALARLERQGHRVERRAAPADDRARALLADGLPLPTRVLVAPPATADDAAYAMAPAIVREVEQVGEQRLRA